MNDENNQKDEGAEDIPYFKCNKCKYLKRADIFFGEALKEYDGEKRNTNLWACLLHILL